MRQKDKANILATDSYSVDRTLINKIEKGVKRISPMMALRLKVLLGGEAEDYLHKTGIPAILIFNKLKAPEQEAAE